MQRPDGCLWHVDAPSQNQFDCLSAVITDIQADPCRCLPILGPGLLDSTFGPQRKIAEAWADNNAFPLAQHRREDLPQVAQFLTMTQSPYHMETTLQKEWYTALLKEHRHHMAQEVANKPLHESVQAVAEYLRRQHINDPHRILAKIPFPLYLTTSPFDHLSEALKDKDPSNPRHCSPNVASCQWWRAEKRLGQNSYPYPNVNNVEPECLSLKSSDEIRLKRDRPLVYHLFGRLVCANWTVLTEDDYIDYLIDVILREDLIPQTIKTALTTHTLLFLGFEVDDWNFRILLPAFRALGRDRNSVTSVAIQIDPDATRFHDPVGARRYLEARFKKINFTIWWSSVENCLSTLGRSF